MFLIEFYLKSWTRTWNASPTLEPWDQVRVFIPLALPALSYMPLHLFNHSLEVTYTCTHRRILPTTHPIPRHKRPTYRTKPTPVSSSQQAFKKYLRVQRSNTRNPNIQLDGKFQWRKKKNPTSFLWETKERYSITLFPF